MTTTDRPDPDATPKGHAMTAVTHTGLPTHDGAEIIIRPCYTTAYWSDRAHDSHDIGPGCSAIRPAWLVCPGVRSSRDAAFLASVAAGIPLHPCGCPYGVGDDIRGHNPGTRERWETRT